MSRDHLRDGADALERAAEGTDDPERARELAETLRSLADRDRGPDHGRLARIERALAELAAGASPDAREALTETTEHVTAYRETVDGI